MSQVPSSVPTILAANPTTQPAVTYDRLWLQSIQVTVGLAGDPGSAVALLLPYHKADDGTVAPIPGGQPIAVTVDNLLVRAATDPALAQLMGALVSYVVTQGIEQGVIAQPQS